MASDRIEDPELVDKPCDECGETVHGVPDDGSRPFCSRRCAENWYLEHVYAD